MYQVKIAKISFIGKKMIKYILKDIFHWQKCRDFYRHFVFHTIKFLYGFKKGGQNVFNEINKEV